MKLIGKAFVLGAAMAVTSIIACSSNHSTGGTGSNTPPGSTQPGGGTGTEDGTGTVGFQYTLPGGEHISSVTYKLTNGTNTYTGTVNVATASTISFLISGVAAGGGYSITLNGTSDDGQVNCIGAVGAANAYANPPGSVVGTTFNVINRATTTVNVNMICLDVANLEAGSVQVNSVTSCCATWDTAVANPTSANTSAPGNTSALSANASAPCGNTDAGTNPVLNCTWAVTTGTGTVGATSGDMTGNFNATFTCPSTGETDTITLTCTDGPLPDGGSCPAWSTTTTATVICGTPLCTTGTSPGGKNGQPSSPSGSGTGSCAAYGAGAINDGTGCCYEPCANSGNEPSTPFSATGSCSAFPGTSNNGAGCCQPLHPCTVAGDTTCVKCQGNTSGLCTPTEAQVVQHDIDKGLATAPGPDPSTSCYSCMEGNSCLDDNQFSDSGHECGDPITGSTTTAECSATLSCIFANSCASAGSVATCYCGTLSSASCKNNPASVNGVCDSQIAAGLGFPVTDGTDNAANLTNTTLASGRADQIILCAINNSCTQCLH
jgi:hypothetical protein